MSSSNSPFTFGSPVATADFSFSAPANITTDTKTAVAKRAERARRAEERRKLRAETVSLAHHVESEEEYSALEVRVISLESALSQTRHEALVFGAEANTANAACTKLAGEKKELALAVAKLEAEKDKLASLCRAQQSTYHKAAALVHHDTDENKMTVEVTMVAEVAPTVRLEETAMTATSEIGSQTESVNSVDAAYAAVQILDAVNDRVDAITQAGGVCLDLEEKLARAQATLEDTESDHKRAIANMAMQLAESEATVTTLAVNLQELANRYNKFVVVQSKAYHHSVFCRSSSAIFWLLSLPLLVGFVYQCSKPLPAPGGFGYGSYGADNVLTRSHAKLFALLLDVSGGLNVYV